MIKLQVLAFSKRNLFNVQETQMGKYCSTEPYFAWRCVRNISYKQSCSVLAFVRSAVVSSEI